MLSYLGAPWIGVRNVSRLDEASLSLFRVRDILKLQDPVEEVVGQLRRDGPIREEPPRFGRLDHAEIDPKSSKARQIGRIGPSGTALAALELDNRQALEKSPIAIDLGGAIAGLTLLAQQDGQEAIHTIA
jgi:hypothetical protein